MRKRDGAMRIWKQSSESAREVRFFSLPSLCTVVSHLVALLVAVCAEEAPVYGAPSGQPKLDLNVSSGEEAFLRRQRMSAGGGMAAAAPAAAALAEPPAKRLKVSPSDSGVPTRVVLLRVRVRLPMSPPRTYQLTLMSSCCVRVVSAQNMVGKGQVDPDLEAETATECAKYGRVLECVVYEIKDNAKIAIEDDEAVRIFVHFADTSGASKGPLLVVLCRCSYVVAWLAGSCRRLEWAVLRWAACSCVVCAGRCVQAKRSRVVTNVQQFAIIYRTRDFIPINNTVRSPPSAPGESPKQRRCTRSKKKVSEQAESKHRERSAHRASCAIR